MKNKHLLGPNNKNTDSLAPTLKASRIDIDTFLAVVGGKSTHYWLHDENYIVIGGNQKFEDRFDACIGQKCYQCLMSKIGVCDCCLSIKSHVSNNTEQCKICKSGDLGYHLNISHTPMTNKDGKKYYLKSFCHIEDSGILAKSFYRQRQNRTQAEIVMVMCSSCYKIKDQQGD